MNQSFENIFKKYNIKCEVPRKRHKSQNTLTQTHKLRRNQHNLVNKGIAQKSDLAGVIAGNSNRIKSLNSDCSFFFNTNTKRKYYNPTRYKTLDVFPLENVHKRFHSSIADNTAFSENTSINEESSNKESYKGKVSASTVDKTCKRNEVPLACLTNRNRCKHSSDISDISAIADDTPLHTNADYSVSNKYLHCGQLDVNRCVDKRKNLDESIEKQPFENNLMHNQKPGESTMTELDLLIDLIKQEEKHKNQQRSSNCDYNLPRTKCVKGGYEELFQKAFRRVKAKCNFLRYDKKIGLRIGLLLTVVNVQTSYNFTLATVKSENLNKNIAVALSSDMASQLKVGDHIEAFFDDKSIPYKLQLNGECIDTYLEPYKLLAV